MTKCRRAPHFPILPPSLLLPLPLTLFFPCAAIYGTSGTDRNADIDIVADFVRLYRSLSLQNHVRIKLSNQQTRCQLQKRCLTSSQQQQLHLPLSPVHLYCRQLQ